MFIHQGKKRTLVHNLQIASLLSFVAGIVNIAGFLAVAHLTTNVTGHFAFFIDEVFQLNYWQSFIYLLYVLSFFVGSFFSSFLVEWISRKDINYVYIIPTAIECAIIAAIAFYGDALINSYPDIIICSLLFAMGLQNSLVTSISDSVVRTTHLTGLFTDLGIELSQLFFYFDNNVRTVLISTIKLRLTIISFFFIGGIVGGIFYSTLGLKVLFLAATALVIGIAYDYLVLRVKILVRRYR